MTPNSEPAKTLMLVPTRYVDLALRCHGVPVGLRVAGPAMAEFVIRHAADYLPGSVVSRARCARSSYRLVEPAPAAPIDVFAGTHRIASVSGRAEALRHMCAHLQTRIAETADDSIFVHAGVVGWKGRAIVFPGRTFSGKSTIVAELVARGATYYSDEYMILDIDGNVCPFPCPLKLPPRASRPGETIPSNQMPNPPGDCPVPVGLLFFLKYSSSQDWSVRELSPGAALLGILRNAVSARKNPSATLRASRQALVSAPAFHGRRGEASRAADQVLELFERRCLATRYSRVGCHVCL